MNIWCPQCGPSVAVDEDGCCNSCGATATGTGADIAAELSAEVQRLREQEAHCHCGAFIEKAPKPTTDGPR